MCLAIACCNTIAIIHQKMDMGRRINKNNHVSFFVPRAMITENDEITLSLVALFGTRKNEVCIA